MLVARRSWLSSRSSACSFLSHCSATVPSSCRISKQTSNPRSLSATRIRNAGTSCQPQLTSADVVGVYGDLLDASTRSKSLPIGKMVHRRILREAACSRNLILLDKLTCFYISCGFTENARRVFDGIPRPSIFLCNTMIRAYSWNGPLQKAIDLYYLMVEFGVKPNKFTFPFVLKACSGLKSLEEGSEIHRHVERDGLGSDVYVATALIDMYMKCGCLEDSREVFNKMSHRDVVAWNSMIAGFSLHGECDDMVDLVLDMQRCGEVPNASTIVSILPVIGQAKALNLGKSVHAFCARRELEKEDVLVGTALLDAYGKCDAIDYASRFFHSMRAMNEVTWSSMIGAYVSNDQMEVALKYFSQMVREGLWNVSSATLASILRACAKLADLGKGSSGHAFSIKVGLDSNMTVGNTMLSMYAMCGERECAFKFFNEMDMKDTVSYSAVISGCIHNGYAKEALVVFRKMQVAHVQPDVATMVGVIPACSYLAALQHGKCSHGCIIVNGFKSGTSLCNSLIDMYAKCGRIDYARKVFDRMVKRDTVSWNSMIVGYGIHGLGKEALCLFSTMQNSSVQPDDVTFICLLSACSHSGFVSEGKKWFHSMTEHFDIVPRMEHFVCMVDLFGRAGLLDEANNFIKAMPIEPDIHVWSALLGACRVHRNVNLGEEVSRTIEQLGPQGTESYVLLSNIYSVVGRFDEAADVRIMQKNKGLKKSPGCSWIEVKGKVHAFVSGDESHPEFTEIQNKLRDLLVKIKKLGYGADTSFVLQNVEDEEKEHALLCHSEKLAIAFGIMNLGSTQPIFVTKNLRICGDCHTAIKYFTLVSRRVISVRDASRFHHFKDGICNCGDFW